MVNLAAVDKRQLSQGLQHFENRAEIKNTTWIIIQPLPGFPCSVKAANPPWGYLFLAFLFFLDHLLAARGSCWVPSPAQQGCCCHTVFCPAWLCGKGDGPPNCWRMEGCECPKLPGYVSQDLHLSGNKNSDIAEKKRILSSLSILLHPHFFLEDVGCTHDP